MLSRTVADILGEEVAMTDEPDARELFGDPNSAGVFLVAVVEFSANADEDGWSMAGNFAADSVSNAARRLGWDDRRDVTIDWRADPITGTLPDGTVLAATQTTVSGYDLQPWYRESRPPTDDELRRWASS